MSVYNAENVKFCPTCKTIKDKFLFSKDTRRNDNLYFQCKECKKEYDKNRRFNVCDADINHKKCICCGEDKLLKDYYINAHCKDGTSNICKKCSSDKEKQQRKQNKLIMHKQELPKDMFVCVKCGELKHKNEYSKNKRKKNGIQDICKYCFAEYKKEYYKINKKEIKQKHRKYRLNNAKKISEYNKKYVEENKDIVRERDKKYRENNRDKINEKFKIYRNNRFTTDNLYKCKVLLRNNIKASLLKYGYSKMTKTHEILGCDWNFFKSYIESQFEEGMTWENHGEYWVFDHIIPISFAMTNDEAEMLCYYHNYQPLIVSENASKGNNIFYNEKTLNKCIDVWLN